MGIIISQLGDREIVAADWGGVRREWVALYNRDRQIPEFISRRLEYDAPPRLSKAIRVEGDVCLN